MSFAEWSNNEKKKQEEKKKREQKANTQAIRENKTSFSDWSNNELASQVDDNFINTFIADTKKFFYSSDEEQHGIDWYNASPLYTVKSNTVEDLDRRERTLRVWLDNNKDRLDADAYSNISSYLDDYKSGTRAVLDVFKKARDHYSQWATEEEYNDAVKVSELYDMSSEEIAPYLDTTKTEAKRSELVARQKEIKEQMKTLGNKGKEAFKKQELQKEFNEINAQIEELDSTSGIAHTTIGGQNITWQNLYDDKKAEEDFNALYESLSSAEDWKKGIDYSVNLKNPTSTEAGGTSLKGVKNKRTYVKENEFAIAFARANGSDVDDLHLFLQMNDKEAEVYDYYLYAGGEKKADEYFESIKSTLKRRDENEQIQQFVNLTENVAVIPDIMSVFASVMSGGEYIADFLKGNAGDANHMSNVSSAIRGTRMQQVDWEIGNWDAFDFLYGTGMSMADSVTSMAMFGNLGGVALGLSAAASSTNDALERGMDKKQAFWTGLTSGVFEGLFETVSIGNFKNLKTAFSSGGKQIAKNIALSMLVNASEETATEIANIAYDYIANGDFSSYETTVRQYMSSGLSESEAKSKAAKELGQQVVEAAGSGALMGLGFGGYAEGANAIGATLTGRSIKKATKSGDLQVSDLVDIAQSLGEGTESYNLASKITDKSSAYAIGKLYGIEGIEISEANRADIVKSLERKGYDTKTATNIANIMLDPENDMFANSRGITDTDKTYKDIVANPNSTVNQRTGAYSDIARAVENSKNSKKNGKNAEVETSQAGFVPYSAEYVESKAKEYEALGLPPAQAKALVEAQLSQSGKVQSSPAEESIVESKFDVSTDGKTINLKTGKEVKVNNIESISSSGEANLTLDDDMVVKASDISFSNEAEAIFVENIGAIKVGKKPISTDSANLLYNAAMSELKNNPNMTANEAMSLIKGLEESYIYGAYNLGRAKLTSRNEDGSARLFAGELSQAHRKYAYELGAKDRVSDAERDQKVIDELVAKAEASAKRDSKGNIIPKIKQGRIIFEEGVDSLESLPDRKRHSIEVGLKLISEISPIEFHIFQTTKDNKGQYSYVLKNGKKIGANGVYLVGTNQIWVDINAGAFGEGTMLWTVAHEISHYIKQWSPVKWMVMADFIVKQYKKEGKPIEKMLEHEADLIRLREERAELLAKKNGTEFTPMTESKILDKAYEEFISNALIRMLDDGSIVENMAELKKVDKTLWEKIGEAIKNLLAKWGLVFNEYKDLTADREAARPLEQMNETFKKLQELYQDAFVDANYAASLLADDVNATIGARNLVDFSEAKNTEGESLFQYRAMEADEATYKDMLKKWGKMTDTQIDNLFTTIDKAMDIIKDNLEVLDYAWEADIDDRAFSPVKPNTDSLYKVSLDFSTLCRERILQQTIQAQLQEALNQPLTREEGIAIRDALMALQEEGRQIEIACALCYVESARMKSPKQIKKFWNNREAVIKDFFAGKAGGSTKDKIKQAEVDARAKLHKENPNGIKGKNGSTLDPRTAPLGAMQKNYADSIRYAKRVEKESYKPTAEEQNLINVAKGMTINDFVTPSGLENLAKNYPDLFDAYARYIVNATHSKGIENDTWWRAGDSSKIGDVLIANMNKENGLRSQSWSDFQVIHILDYIASTIELSTRNAKEQAYSKVPDYVELMGQTGVMLNMSLIPTRKFNGSLEYDSVEGMAYKRALELREKYPATAGTICIGIDNKQIQMLLADATIDYVIPYHKSGMAAAIRKLMHIPTWTQYEEYQSEKNLSRKEAEAQAKKYGVKLLAESDPNYQKHTAFSEWFDLEVAKQIAKMENANPSNKAMQKKYGVMYGGYMAMQGAANNYLKLCAERGLSPKFSHEKADFTAEDNYWKLLIDRKMVNNATGKIIEQQTIQPIFDEGEVLRILNDELERYPSVKADQEYAIRKVTEKFLSGEIKSGMSAEAIAEVMKTPVDNIAKTNILASAEEIKEFDSSEERIAQNIRDVAEMSSVYDVDESKLEKTGKRPSDIFAEHFDSWGNRLYSDELGDIAVEKASVKSEIRHGITAEKIASIEAIPTVIKEGKIIFTGMKPNSDVQRIVVCAPIKIGATPYYMGVMLQRDTKTQRLYLHNVAIEKEASELSQDDLLTTGSDENNEYLFMTSILQNAMSVKYQNGLDMRSAKDADASETLFQERNVAPIESEDLTKLEKHFGTTGNFRVAGYLLTDGKLLDFSGKHWGDTTSRMRQVDHRDVQEVLDDRGNNGVNAMVDMIGNGNIRLMPETGGINLAVYPNEKQRRVLSQYINYMLNTEGQIVIDYDAVGGDTVYSKEYGKTATSKQILSDIRNYFNGARQSELMQFHTMSQERDPEASNRYILANALEGAAQNDIEKRRLAEYKEKIALIESEESKLSAIQKQLFTKGGVEPENRKKLQFEAKQLSNRINTYDRQLLNLEATTALKNVLNREKALAAKRQKQKDNEALRKYKEKVAETQRELMTRYQDSRKRATESRNKTAMRHKIQKVVSELNQLLLKGSKERNVKLGLQESVAKALEVINMDTVGADERVAKYNELIAKAKDPDVIASLTETRDRIAAQGDRLSDKLEAMKKAYAEIRKNSDKTYAPYYQQEAQLIEDAIDKVIEKVGDTSLRNMTLEQLEAVYDMYKVVLQTVRYANELHTEGKVEELRENASAMMTELEKIKTLKEERLAVGDMLREFTWNEMIPIYAVRRTGSATLEKFYWEMIRGQNTYAQDVEEANEFKSAVREKHGYYGWDLEKVHSFKLADGRTFRVTLGHMMSIYAYSKREQAIDHMSVGGFFFNDKSTFRKKGGVLKMIKSNEAGYTVNPEVLNTIKEEMEKVAKGSTQYVDEMQGYLTSMGAKGNEVSRVVWGIDIFKEKVYFPLKSVKDFIFQANQTAQETSLKHDGMTKETKPGASNPIVLETFDDVWAGHVERMSQYHGFVIPIDNMNKLLNYGSWAGTESVSVSTMLRARFGEAVNEYFNQFIKDMNGASSTSGAKNPFFGLVGKFKKTAVAASMSVVAQQPTAILRAMAVLDNKYFLGLPEAHRLSTKWNELKQYAPIAIIKDIGGFDAGGGRQVKEWLNSDARRGADKVLGKIDDITMKGAAIGDQVGWCAIWEAVKRETQAKHKDLKVGSEEFLKKAGERFTEVIVLTQVYDSTLSRSGYMRSKHDSVKMLTSFMGEPTVSINMEFNAILQAKRGAITKRNAGKILGATYAATIAASVAASLIYALRDDDDDESYLEKFAEAFGDKLLGDLNPLNQLPGVKDIISIFEGWDVERTDMAIFKDIKDAFDGLFSENKSTWRKVEDFAGAMASIFGVPLKNLLRTGREIYNGVNAIFDDIQPKDVDDAFVRGVKGEKKDKSKALYDAIVSGDEARLKVYRDGYEDDEAYMNAVKTAIAKNNPDVIQTASDLINANFSSYQDMVDELVSLGFDKNVAADAINSIVSKVKSAAQYEADGDTEAYEEKVAELLELGYDEQQLADDIESFDASPSDDDDEAESIYSKQHYVTAVINNDPMADAIKQDLIDVEIQNGKTEEGVVKSLNNALDKAYKKEYYNGNMSDSEVTAWLKEKNPDDTDADIYWATKKWKAQANHLDDEDYSYSKYDEFYEAILDGDNITMNKFIAECRKYNNYKKNVNKEVASDIASAITSHFKPIYIDATPQERAILKRKLLNAYASLGYARSKRSDLIDKWLED